MHAENRSEFYMHTLSFKGPYGDTWRTLFRACRGPPYVWLVTWMLRGANVLFYRPNRCLTPVQDQVLGCRRGVCGELATRMRRQAPALPAERGSARRPGACSQAETG